MINFGVAKLTIARDGDLSQVVDEYCQTPLQLHRPLYLDGQAYPTVYLKTPSSGLLKGDEHQIEIKVEAGSELELRTQAATLVYPGRSSLTIKITVEDGGKLTFLPHPLILGAGANLSVLVQIVLSSQACLVYSDTWCAGRIAMNEVWQFERFAYCMEIFRSTDLSYRENWCLNPRAGSLCHPAICGDYTHFSTLYVFGETAESEAIASAMPLNDWEDSLTWTLSRDNGVITKRCAMARAGAASEQRTAAAK